MMAIDDAKLTEAQREKRSHFVTKLALNASQTATCVAQMQALQLDRVLVTKEREAFEASLPLDIEAPVLLGPEGMP